jgi:4-alpha-glucanotransferase
MSKHGINLPLSALVSKKSSGIGEYLNLLPLIDWCKEVGFSVIQLLPLNDSGYDPSPYNAITSTGLNPAYISLSSLDYIEEENFFSLKLASLRKYNSYQRIKYDDVLRSKMEFLSSYYNHFLFRILKNEKFNEFKQKHPWVKNYVLFKILRENYNLASWEKWPYEIRNPCPKTLCNLLDSYAEEVEMRSYFQFLCYSQLKMAKEYAASKGVELMGDIPILISKESADVWVDRSFFDMSLVAGAPPDLLNKEGQYWGFPLYDWNGIEASQYSFWKNRLQFAANFYDIFRIDHIVGFYRIWAIPPGELATKGHFIPEEESKWVAHGHKILSSLISFTKMHAIGEDLGVIPKEIYPSLFEMGIDRTIMMRWERDYETTGDFIPFKDYYKGSLSTVSTHDSETLAQWVSEYKEEFQLYCKCTGLKYEEELSYSLRLEILKQAHHTNSHYHINLFQEYLALFEELVSPHMADERINVPGKILPTNWTYRFRPLLEEIMEHEPLKKAMKKIIEPL